MEHRRQATLSLPAQFTSSVYKLKRRHLRVSDRFGRPYDLQIACYESTGDFADVLQISSPFSSRRPVQGRVDRATTGKALPSSFTIFRSSLGEPESYCLLRAR